MPSKPASYEQGIYQLLAIYRYFALALAVALEFTLNLPERPDSLTLTYVVLGLLSGYTLLKVAQPHGFYQGTPGRALLATDALVCLGLTLASGGLDSGLLLYSLSPLLTASLLYRPWGIWPVAIASPAVLALGHLAGSQLTGELPWLLRENFLGILALYGMACLVMTVLAQRTNINVYRRIERESAREERKRLARELHDGLAQSLGYLKWRAKAGQDFALAQDTRGVVETLEDIQRTADHLHDEVRDSIDWLADEGGDSGHAELDLKQHINDFGDRVGLEVEFIASGRASALSPGEELEMRRLVQEALTNVKKHSGVARATVSLTALPGYDEITVRDEGRGFSLEQGQAEGYRGLQMMKERAQSLGGRLEMVSAPGRGTSVTLRVPRNRRQ